MPPQPTAYTHPIAINTINALRSANVRFRKLSAAMIVMPKPISGIHGNDDGGTTWNQAQLQPALSLDSWVLWTWQWTPRLPGSYTLVVRATDGTGELQTSRQQGTVPKGATGYHMVKVIGS